MDCANLVRSLRNDDLLGPAAVRTERNRPLQARFTAGEVSAPQLKRAELIPVAGAVWIELFRIKRLGLGLDRLTGRGGFDAPDGERRGGGLLGWLGGFGRWPAQPVLLDKLGPGPLTDEEAEQKSGRENGGFPHKIDLFARSTRRDPHHLSSTRPR